jgi:hypothetical protein
VWLSHSRAFPQDQFSRLRDGDRLWYKNIFPPEEYNKFPNLSEMIKLVCSGMELFPSDPYLLYNPNGIAGGEGSCSAGHNSNQLNLLQYVEQSRSVLSNICKN